MGARPAETASLHIFFITGSYLLWPKQIAKLVIASSKTQPPEFHGSPLGLRIWAWITVLLTFPLLTLGAEVTTKKVGMVDKVGFRAPWHLMNVWQEGSLQARGIGYVIEHSHRIAGFVVGICVIVLALGLWLGEKRRWLCWLGVAALGGVILQGVLGIFRVNLDSWFSLGPRLALIHGCTAQLVFGLLLGIAIFCSKSWSTPIQATFASANLRKIKRLASYSLILVYLQLVLGAVVRHADWLLGARLHLLMAFIVVAMIAWLLNNWFSRESVPTGERSVGIFLIAILFGQLLLGMEAWLTKFYTGPTNQWHMMQPLGLPQDLIRSFHYVTGSLVFAGTLSMTLLAFRKVSPTKSNSSSHLESKNRLEGVL